MSMNSSKRRIVCFTPDQLTDTYDAPILPEGHTFAEDISITDIYRLQAGCSPLKPGEWERRRKLLEQRESASFIDVAVQNVKGTAVGIGTIGILNVDEVFAELSGFIVDQNSQHKGIGRAILDLRVSIASIHTPNIFVYRLDKTNSLAQSGYYETRHGFTRSDSGIPALYRGIFPNFS